MQTLADELLSRWDGAEEKPSPEELCAAHPELLPELRRRIGLLQAADKLLQGDGRSNGAPPAGPLEAVEEGPGLSAALAAELAGAPQVEGYRITGRLGEGGMGVVWEAVQLSTRRTVALKLMSATGFGSARAKLRFAREVELAARLDHPHVARVYDSGLHRGTYFYAMELVRGLPLDDYARQRSLPRRAVLELVLRVCRAVQHAHQRGVIHRDLKPSNVLVDDAGEPHVLDFGLAKLLDAEPDALAVSRDGDVAGTPAYMSPEQAAGKVDLLDARTDVYSLGVILYRLLLGRLPHDAAGGYAQLVRRVSEQDVKSPRSFDRSIDDELDVLLLKALARDPDRRYRSAADLADDLESYLNGEPLRARRPSVGYVLRKRVSKHRLSITLAACGVAVLAGVTGFAAARSAGERRARAAEAAAKAQVVASSESTARAAAARGDWSVVLAAAEQAQKSGLAQPLSLRLLRAEALQNSGRTNDGIAEVDSLRLSSPAAAEDPGVLLRQGMLLWNRDAASSRAALERALARGLPPADDAFARGMLAERPLDSIRQFEAALAANPAHHEANAELALLLVLLGRAPEAEQRTAAWAMIYPREPLAQFSLAIARASNGDLPGARNAAAATGRILGPAAEKELNGWVDLAYKARDGDSLLTMSDADFLGTMKAFLAGGDGIVSGLASGVALLTRLPGGASHAEFRYPRALDTVAGAVGKITLRSVFQSWDDTEAAAERLAELVPNGAFTFHKAMTHIAAGRWAEAEPLLRRAMQEPSMIDVRRLAAFYAFIGSGEFPSRTGKPFTDEQRRVAREYADFVFEHGGFRPGFESERGCNYAKALGLLDVARRVTTEWERKSPGDPAPFLEHAVVEYWDGNYGWTLRLSERVLEKDPKNERALRCRRVATYCIGKKDRPTGLPPPEVLNGKAE